MEVTLLRLSRFSEIVVFMRILDLTLGRGKFREELVTISHIQHGQEGFGTIGIPVSRRRVELALKALKDRRFIRIHKENRTAPVMSILINAPGLTALHAKEKGTWESKSVFWMTHALYEEAYLSQILLIDGENILDLTTELTPSREDLIKELLLALSSDDVDISPSGKWSMGRCPLAAWTHEGGTDDHPSFGIRIDRNGDVHYHCFTCSDGKTTPIRYLFSLVEKMSGEYPLEADAITRVARFCTEAQDDSRVELRKRPRIATPENVVPLPDSYVERFPLLQKICPSDDVQALKCQEYVVRRGINFLSLERLKVRYVPWAKEPILIFPYTDTQGRVFVLAARNVERKKGFFVWNEKIDTEAAGIRFPRLSESFAWFGLDRLDPSTRVMLVEGEMDALKLVTLGYSNVIASGSAELTATQMEALRAYPFLILGFDSDSAGRKAAERVAAFLLNQNNSPPAIEIANWNLAKRTDGNACKDPADLVDACSLDLVMTNLESLS